MALLSIFDTVQKPFKVRDKRNRGWFFVDNDYLNGFGKYLGVPALGVYLSLCRHADSEQRCFPAQELIAEELGITNRTVIKYLNLLKKHNVIAVEREKRGRKWASNTYYLIDKSEWKYPPGYQAKSDQVKTVHVNEKAGSGESDDIYQVNDVHTKDTHRTIPIKETHSKAGALQEVSLIIDLFKEINPTYKDWFNNKTQRTASEWLLTEYGFERVTKMVAMLPKLNSTPYAPITASPYELKRNMARIKSFLEQNKVKGQKITKQTPNYVI